MTCIFSQNQLCFSPSVLPPLIHNGFSRCSICLEKKWSKTWIYYNNCWKHLAGENVCGDCDRPAGVNESWQQRFRSQRNLRGKSRVWVVSQEKILVRFILHIPTNNWASINIYIFFIFCVSIFFAEPSTLSPNTFFSFKRRIWARSMNQSQKSF